MPEVTSDSEQQKVLFSFKLIFCYHSRRLHTQTGPIYHLSSAYTGSHHTCQPHKDVSSLSTADRAQNASDKCELSSAIVEPISWFER